MKTKLHPLHAVIVTFVMVVILGITAQSAQAQSTITVTVGIAGYSTDKTFSVDGTNYLGSSVRTFNWVPGSLHTIGVISPQEPHPGVRHRFVSWSDQGAITHTVAPTNNTNYTVSLATQYYLTMGTGGMSGGSVTPSSGWYDEGTQVAIAAYPPPDTVLNEWFDPDFRDYGYRGLSLNWVINMLGPLTELAIFVSGQPITLAANVPGLMVGSRVSGNTPVDFQPAPHLFRWPPSIAYGFIATISPQTGPGNEPYYFSHWSDGGGIYHYAQAVGLDARITAYFFPVPRLGSWGRNDYGQTNIPPGLRDLAVAGGTLHSLALKDDRSVLAWGQNGSGETNVPASVSNVVAIAAGWGTSLALKQDGRVAAWGWLTVAGSPVVATLTGVVAVAAGWDHALALRGDGSVVCWGANNAGQTNVPAGLSNVVAVAGGGYHSLALRGDGRVIAWGNLTNVPADVSNVVAIATGKDHCLALKQDGSVIGWTSGGYLPIPGAWTNVESISAGDSHSLALQRGGNLLAWGSNSHGQATVPLAFTNVVSAAAGGFHNVVMLSNSVVRPAPVVSNLMRSGNSFSLSVPTTRGTTYFLEFADSLTSSAWTMLPPVPGDGSLRTLTDPTASNTNRFYRVRQR